MSWELNWKRYLSLLVSDNMKEEVKKVSPPQSAAVKQELTEEDLEEWLDSMIS